MDPAHAGGLEATKEVEWRDLAPQLLWDSKKPVHLDSPSLREVKISKKDHDQTDQSKKIMASFLESQGLSRDANGPQLGTLTRYSVLSN